METSDFTFSGDGKLDFSKLKSTASQGTTFNNQPGKDKDYGVTTVAPGNSYSIATFDCPAGEAVSFEISAAGDTSLKTTTLLLSACTSPSAKHFIYPWSMTS
ncbi:hypothetical protein Golomagni_06989 [Golovinomyces magnicellulatus]|nr:hypothetical protein Golomagni_06989 [Golovinomyces magnicellulatus]